MLCTSEMPLKYTSNRKKATEKTPNDLTRQP